MYTGTYNRLRVHVRSSNIDVIRAARKKIKPQFRKTRAHRDARHAYFRELLAIHWRWQATCKHFRM